MPSFYTPSQIDHSIRNPPGLYLCTGIYLPTPSESLDWRGFRKNGLQNLEPQRVRH